MAIQNRRGSYSDFAGGANLQDGEFGIVMSGDTNTTDGTGTYISNGGGIVHRLLTDDDKTEIDGDIASLNATLSQLSPTAFSNGTLETNNGYFNGGICRYVKIGKVVFVFITDLKCITADAPHGTKIFSGLPTAGTSWTFVCSRYSANGSTYSIGLRLQLRTDGSIYTHYSTPDVNSQQFYGTFWYIAN